MASRRTIKRDINRLTFQLVSDSFMALRKNPGLKSDPVIKLIDDTIEIRNNLIYRVNHPSSETGTGAGKKEYSQIRKDLVEQMDKSFVRLSELVKPGKK